MKIGIDCHNLEGQRTGVGRYLWNLLREFNRTGSDPVLLSRARQFELLLYFKGEIPEDVRQLSQHTKGWNLKNLNGGSNALFKHWLLPRAARRDGVDVLFCPDYVLPFYVGGGIKTAVTIHDIIYEARPEEYSWPSWKDKILLKWASKQSAKKADVIFAPSEFTKNELLKHYRVKPEKVVVTPLAPDSIFKKSDFSGVLPQKYIFFVGSIFNRRFLPQKIRAFTEFGKNYPDFKFLIIGQNHTQPFQDIGALITRANEKLGREAVVWKRRASDENLVRLYNAAFATLWLSSYEGFGLPVLESMACGTPVITSPMGSLPEIAGDAAMYIDEPESPAHIHNALNALASDDSYYRGLVSKGLAQSAKFSWRKTARDTLERIASL